MRDRNLDTNPMFSEDSILPEQFRAPTGRTSAEKPYFHSRRMPPQPCLSDHDSR